MKHYSPSAKNWNIRLANRFPEIDKELESLYAAIADIDMRSRRCGGCSENTKGVCRILHDMVPEGGRCVVPTPEFNAWKERF